MMRTFFKVAGYLGEHCYRIGFIDDPFLTPFDFRRVQWLDTGNYRNGWFADPFICKVSDTEIVLFAEEFVYATRKGRIVRLTVQREGFRLKRIEVLLECDTHLSFPLFVEEGVRFVCPENHQSGVLKVYRYDEAAGRLTDPQVLVDERLVDAQFVKIGGWYYVMGVRYPGWFDAARTLYIYRSDALTGPYEEVQRIENPLREERGAGRLFERNGRWIRPAQSCEDGYGKEVIFYEMTLHEGSFSEKELFRLAPIRRMRYGLGVHAFDCRDGVAVIDGSEYRRFLAGRLSAFFWRIWNSCRSAVRKRG